MTRRPRKTTSRPRLLIVDPFPMCHYYWNEYCNDAFNYLLEIESRYDRYMYMAPDSTFSIDRQALVLWVIGICYREFDYQRSTVHAAIHIMDRYLIAKGSECTVEDLQAIGICASMIAGKLDETACAVNVERCLIFCNFYTSKHLAKTELAILVALKFEILVASATGFADFFKRAVPALPEVSALFDFLCDISLLSSKFLDYNTSQIAASAMWIALCAAHKDWNENLAIFTGYSRIDLTPCSMIFKELVESLHGNLNLQNKLQIALGSQYPLAPYLQTLNKVLEC
ncbi:hypothetical protein BX616_009769 [Lobosporangium transversale]|uniref:Cyclin-like protein n=1 Tax=Lobosporangium transversale TaxID=64571 RepID=A0A1Y2GDW8_9FUNG|nr:cyclin-like protein [Lobosporangium transversale]KAF9918242.1 hypothetical protein BX616_009769 [Lobosporangium transversale]ORZ08039.1 cyclin-like protein [Lobosporangium transversale]|eukprot:XP_021878273.1 cyclin-like protein [Lobosporangium transversale]